MEEVWVTNKTQRMKWIQWEQAMTSVSSTTSDFVSDSYSHLTKPKLPKPVGRKKFLLTPAKQAK